jgi:hypothetical protein
MSREPRPYTGVEAGRVAPPVRRRWSAHVLEQYGTTTPSAPPAVPVT